MLLSLSLSRVPSGRRGPRSSVVGAALAIVLLLAASSGRAQITQILDSSGDGTNAFDTAWALATDASGNVFVATGGGTNSVFKITPGGAISRIIDSTGDGTNSLFQPFGIATDDSGNVFVSSFIGDSAFKITPGGAITQIIDATGDGTTPLRSPLVSSVGTDPSGNVFVAGLDGNVFKITPGGVITKIIDPSGDGTNALGSPQGVCTDGSGNVFVLGTATDNAFKITPGGVITQIIDATGDGTNALALPRHCDTDSAGNLYLTAGNSNNAFKITPGGVITQIIDASGDGTNALDGPAGVATDPSGNVFVCGDDSDNAFMITPGGAISQIIDASGDGTNVLAAPSGIATDDEGNVFLGSTDINNGNNVFKIAAPGGSGPVHYVEYKTRESDKKAPDGVLARDCNVTLDDPLFDFADGETTAENYEIKKNVSLGLPADKNDEGGGDLAGTHLIGMQAKPSKKGALPVVDGKFRKGRKHAKRFGVEVTIDNPTFHDGGTNTIRIDTNRVTRLLVPANKDFESVPTVPADSTDHYKCYKAKASKTSMGTLQDSAGKELKNLQVVAEDQFADGAGHATYGDARLYDLKKVVEICNPVTRDDVDMVETDDGGETRTSTCTGSAATVSNADSSLICWQAKAATKSYAQPWDMLEKGTPIEPKQAKHVKRTRKDGTALYVGHPFTAPNRLDTSKELTFCMPADITDVGTTAP